MSEICKHAYIWSSIFFIFYVRELLDIHVRERKPSYIIYVYVDKRAYYRCSYELSPGPKLLANRWCTARGRRFISLGVGHCAGTSSDSLEPRMRCAAVRHISQRGEDFSSWKSHRDSTLSFSFHITYRYSLFPWKNMAIVIFIYSYMDTYVIVIRKEHEH